MTKWELQRASQRLQVSSERLKALLWVRKKLRSGKIVHHGSKCSDDGSLLNMAVWLNTETCGTVGCIGGWIEYKLSGAMYGHSTSSESDSLNMHGLLYPPGSLYWTMIDADEAVRAIDSWIATGNAHWREVVTDPEKWAR